MTSATCFLILGRPFSHHSDDSESEVLERYGVDGVEGLECLYQGDTYIGVEVRTVWRQSGEMSALKGTELSWTPEQEEKARRICDAIPEAMKAGSDLMPFGAYLVGEDG